MAVQASYTNGASIAAASGGNHAGSPAHTILTGIYDSTRLNVVSGDVIPVVNIPAGTLIKNVILEVITGQATVTLGLGKTGTTAGYLAATAVTTAGTKTAGTAGSLIVASGDFIATAGTVDLLVGGATAAGVVVKVHVLCAIV